jgi:2,4'-dihydroxyacetophenone dioxygenase
MALPKVVHGGSRLLTVNVNESEGVPMRDPGVTLTPLFLDRENGVWVLYAKFEPGTRLPTHFHTGTVHFFTTKGSWGYLEHPEDPQTAGSYLYEPGGAVHTFAVPADAKEPAEGFMVVYGANINFLEGEYHSIVDAGALEDGIRKAAAFNGMAMPRYVRPRGGAEFAGGAAAPSEQREAVPA